MIVTLEVDVDVNYADRRHGEPRAGAARVVAASAVKAAFASFYFERYRRTRTHPALVKLAGVRVKKETPEL